MELDDNIYNKIVKLCEDGDTLIEIGKPTEAIKNYIDAFKLLPEPKLRWKASTWIYTAIGDAYFLECMYKESLEYMLKALKSPDGGENPFIFLRVGQCYYEMREFDKAKIFFLEAYKYDGKKVFEAEDSKYFYLIKYII